MLPVVVVTALEGTEDNGHGQISEDRYDYHFSNWIDDNPVSYIRPAWNLVNVPVTSSPNIVPTPTNTPVATPTPTLEDVVLPTQTPVPVLLRSSSYESFDRLLDSVFGAASLRAYAVADCEQGYKLSAGVDPFELNRTTLGYSGEVSLWQIHPIHFWKYDRERLRADVRYAAQAAWELSGFGSNWIGPWKYCGWQ